MAFLASSGLGQYSPALSIRCGVSYERQSLIPDSGRYNIEESSYVPSWNFFNSLKQNSRINGRFDLEDNFEQGYFNFENWNGNTCYSSDYSKSGVLVNPGNGPYFIDFWGRRDTFVGRQALYNFIEPSGFKPNITRSVVMSGTNGGPYSELKLYTGSIPSGEITIYGRVGNVNPNYNDDDTIVRFTSLSASAEADYGDEVVTSETFASTVANNVSIGTEAWTGLSDLSSNNSNGPEWFSTAPSQVSNYLVGTGFGLSIPTDASIVQVEFKVKHINVSGATLNDWDVRLFNSGSAVGSNKATVTPIVDNTTRTFTWTGGELGGLAAADLNGSTFGFGYSIKRIGGAADLMVDSFSVTVTYQPLIPSTNDNLIPLSFSLINRGDGTDRILSWRLDASDSLEYIDLTGHQSRDNEFSNYLFTYSSGTGLGLFYVGYDGQPLSLVNSRYLGDITTVFNGLATFHEDSYSYSTLTNNNPKIITDFGISNRAWDYSEVLQFNRHKLNAPCFIEDNPASVFPPSSGSDSTYLNFHFPVGSSGTLGACQSGNPYSIGYYVPFNSGVNSRLHEFDNSTSSPTALLLNMWVENVGSNQSGNIGANIKFGSRSLLSSRELFNTRYTWSGYPVQVPSGIKQVTMSGVIYDTNYNVVNLNQISKAQGNEAELSLGVWYNNVGREYAADFRVYSTRAYLDGWVTHQSANENIPLSISGSQVTTSNLTLYLHSNHVSSGCSLYVCGYSPTYSGINLFIAGIQDNKSTAFMPMYTYSAPIPVGSGQVPLYMWATTNSGLSQNIPLFIGEAFPSGNKGGSLNLFINGPEYGTANGGMNLYIDCDAPTEYGQIPLTCFNDYSLCHSSVSLYMCAPSGTLGAIPASGSMNLFIARSSEGIAGGIPMYIGGPNQSSGATPLFIMGGTPYFSSIPLNIDGIGTTQGSVRLYTHGF